MSGTAPLFVFRSAHAASKVSEIPTHTERSTLHMSEGIVLPAMNQRRG